MLTARNGLLRRRGLEPCTVPADTDYTMLLERRGIGLPHTKLRADEPLTERDIITYLAHSRVTEQRAADQMDMLARHFAGHPEIGAAVRVIHDLLRRSALAEIAVHRDVGLAVMTRMGRILRWPAAKSAALTAGIHALYAYERLGGWRRMVTLRVPERRDALGGPVTTAPEFVRTTGAS